jgi:plastocyanin
MVFAINPPIEGPRTFAAFKQLAMSGAAPPATTSPAGWQIATATVSYGGSVYTTTYTSYDGTPPPTPAAEPTDHKVIVGENGLLTYTPDRITAAIRDTVTFEFRTKNHTVTQSSFANPCVKFVGADGTPGFASGFQPVAAGATEFPTFQITINDTAPIWGYCGQTGHCGQGMVFSINSVETGANNFAAFKAEAQRANGSATTSPTGTAGSADNSAVRGTVQVGLAGVMMVLGLVHFIL